MSAGVPLRRRRRPWLHSSPPERLFGFESDVAPRQPDIVQVALGPVGELAALLLTMAPDMQGFPDPGPEAGTMMITHRFVSEGGHVCLLKLTSATNIYLERRVDKRHFVPSRMTQSHLS